MTRIVRRRFISKLTQSFLSYLILIILASLFIYSAIGAYHKSRLAGDKMELAKKDFTNLEDQKAKLMANLQNANTEFGREKALREKFNVIKEGEQVIMLVDDKDATTAPSDKPKDSGFIEFFKNLFKGS